MPIARRTPLLAACLVACIAVPAGATERVRPGNWETTLTLGGRVVTRPVCLSKNDADDINGDARSIRAYLERTTAPAGCHVSDVKLNGNQVTVTSTCASGKTNVGTTTYFGDRYESVNTNGAKLQSRWTGACR